MFFLEFILSQRTDSTGESTLVRHHRLLNVGTKEHIQFVGAPGTCMTDTLACIADHRLLNVPTPDQTLTRTVKIYKIWVPIVENNIPKEHLQFVGPPGTCLTDTWARIVDQYTNGTLSYRDIARLKMRMHTQIIMEICQEAIWTVIGRKGGAAEI